MMVKAKAEGETCKNPFNKTGRIKDNNVTRMYVYIYNM